MSRKPSGTRSIRELISAIRCKHIVTISYQGESYDFPWMELQDEEMPPIQTPPADATQEEVNEISVRGLDALTFRMIAKASMEDGVEITEDMWRSIPKRMRNELMMSIFSLQTEIKKDFLERPTKT